jgi:hypothetical protein
MRRLHAALCSLVAASALILCGCEEDTTDTTETEDVGPATMELVSPAEGACVPIGSDPDTHVSFVLKTSALYLRAPGICGDAVQCGQLLLWANDKLYERSASNVIEWDLVNVIDRYGEFSIKIAAVTDSDAPINDAEGAPLVVTRSITTAVSCEAAR